MLWNIIASKRKQLREYCVLPFLTYEKAKASLLSLKNTLTGTGGYTMFTDFCTLRIPPRKIPV